MGAFKTTGFHYFNNQIEIVDPVFQGGPGATLEMRPFTLEEVLRLLEKSGFYDIEVHDYDFLNFGIRRNNKILAQLRHGNSSL